jgi:hypothetical protein
MKKIPFRTVIAFCLLILLAASCKKDPGPGGSSTIYGKVYMKDYNSTFTLLEEQYYAPDVWVFIIYGDDRDYGDKVRTGPGGVYEFKYMRKGSYQVYAYSKDSTLQTTAQIPVIQNVNVSKNNEDVQVPDIVIFN